MCMCARVCVCERGDAFYTLSPHRAPLGRAHARMHAYTHAGPPACPHARTRMWRAVAFSQSPLRPLVRLPACLSVGPPARLRGAQVRWAVVDQSLTTIFYSTSSPDLSCGGTVNPLAADPAPGPGRDRPGPPGTTATAATAGLVHGALSGPGPCTSSPGPCTSGPGPGPGPGPSDG